MRILIIEDEIAMAETITDALKSTYVIDLVHTAKEGLYQSEVNDYDLIILDLGLPDLDGLEACRRIRQNGVKIPILILTGKAAVEDKVAALDACADDYLTKPFNFAELGARIRALLRRSPDTLTSNVLVVDDLILNTLSRTVSRHGKELHLGRKEFDLLEYLMRNQGKVLSRGKILEHVWDSEADSLTNFIDVNIKYLRDKIDRPYPQKLIKTVRGYGYKIEA